MSSKKDFYALFGLGRNATPAQIKSQFYRLSLKYHPDQNDNKESVKKYHDILEAYNILKDPGKRRQYDLQKQTISDYNSHAGRYGQTEKHSHSRYSGQTDYSRNTPHTTDYSHNTDYSRYWKEWSKGRYTEKDPVREKPTKPKDEGEERDYLMMRMIALFSGLVVYVCTLFQHRST